MGGVISTFRWILRGIWNTPRWLLGIELPEEIVINARLTANLRYPDGSESPIFERTFDVPVFEQVKKSFQTVGARLRKVRRGSVIFELVFFSLNDITLFRHAYEDGGIEKELREILTAALKDEGRLCDLKLSIDRQELLNAERLAMGHPGPSDNVEQGSSTTGSNEQPPNKACEHGRGIYTADIERAPVTASGNDEQARETYLVKSDWIQQATEDMSAKSTTYDPVTSMMLWNTETTVKQPASQFRGKGLMYEAKLFSDTSDIFAFQRLINDVASIAVPARAVYSKASPVIKQTVETEDAGLQQFGEQEQEQELETTQSFGMAEEHRLVLQKAKQQLIRDLNPIPILDDLRALVSDEDFHRLGAMRVRHDQARELLFLLTQQGPGAFEAFKSSLKKNQPHLYDLLTKTLQHIKNGVPDQPDAATAGGHGISPAVPKSGMTPHHEDVLKKAHTALVEDLDPDRIIDYLFQEGVLTEEDYSTLRAHSLRHSKARELVTLLPRRGCNAYPNFKTALMPYQSHLYDLLNEYEESTETAIKLS